jgi:hypothetical protein
VFPFYIYFSHFDKVLATEEHWMVWGFVAVLQIYKYREKKTWKMCFFSVKWVFSKTSPTLQI